MKKIFTFVAIILLGTVGMTAAVPTGTLNPANVPADGWAGKYTPAYIENGDWVCFSPYEIYQSIATGQSWAAAENSGSTSGSWDATDPFPAQSAWTTNDGKVATVRQGQKGPYYYRITNTTDVAALVKSGSNKKRTVFLEAYELTAGVAPETPTKTTSMESSTMGVISLSDLDKTKEYLIVVRAEDTGTGGSSSGNSNYYAIGFKTVASTDPVLGVSPAEISLNVTASNTNPSAKVTFSGKNLAAGTYNLSVPDLAGLTVSPASVTVGEDGKLNAEVTISYTSAVEVAAASTSVDLTIGALTKVVVVNYSATLTKKYMQSINIEQLVLDNGTNYDIRAAFDAANIEYNNIDALDTLNDIEEKTARNYAFLGLKIKKTDSKLAGWLKAGQTIKVRFGNVGANFKISAMGMDSTCTAENFANTTVESNKVLEFTAPIDMYLEIVCNSTKTLVIKQIMINQEIAPVVLPAPSAYLITIQAGEHGTVTATWENKKYRTPVGALVTLTPQPDEGYKTVSLTWNGTPLYDDHVGYVTFTMPAEDVTVVAQFDTDFPTDVESIQSTEISAKKRIVNGVLYIEKNGTLYNAQGGIVK